VPWATRIITVVATVAALTACSSSPSSTRAAAPPAPSDTNVVDGITIPPIYQPPTPTVVPGPASCPSEFATTLNSAAQRGTFALESDRSDHLLTCTYQNRQAAPGRCVKATIRVNTEPQAFMAFVRWNVETGQNSMWSHDPNLQPVPVSGIGIEAEWVPALRELGTANQTTWVSVYVTCPGSASQVPGLARVLAQLGLASAG
jgi:hypothetical protein